MTGLRAHELTLAYDGSPVVDHLNLDLPPQRFTVIVGPNGCGKSTLLRGLGRLLPTRAGQVLLDGADIHRLPTREVARRVGLLPQGSTAPDGVTVEELVRRGRFPYQRLLGGWTAGDQRAVERALARTDTAQLAARTVDQLSGGQRQRVWIALTLAQETPLLLLDEPTTYLDLRHQLDVLDLLAGLAEEGRTIVAVLHDLNHACRYADHLVVLHGGHVVAAGPPQHVVTAELVRHVFDVPCQIVPDPVTGTPLVVPHRRTTVPQEGPS